MLISSTITFDAVKLCLILIKLDETLLKMIIKTIIDKTIPKITNQRDGLNPIKAEYQLCDKVFGRGTKNVKHVWNQDDEKSRSVFLGY